MKVDIFKRTDTFSQIRFLMGNLYYFDKFLGALYGKREDFRKSKVITTSLKIKVQNR
jgi:hypothetical protein